MMNTTLDAFIIYGQKRGEVVKCVGRILHGNFSEEMTFKLNFKR